jgi:hypothetical protein
MTSPLIALLSIVASAWAIFLVHDDAARKKEGAILGSVQLCIVAMLLLTIGVYSNVLDNSAQAAWLSAAATPGGEGALRQIAAENPMNAAILRVQVDESSKTIDSSKAAL